MQYKRAGEHFALINAKNCILFNITSETRKKVAACKNRSLLSPTVYETGPATWFCFHLRAIYYTKFPMKVRPTSTGSNASYYF
jgi:hypothetical protein